MKNMTRFLPGFTHILCGRPPKSALAQLKPKLAHLRESTLSELSDLFDRWIPLGVLQPKSEKENSRERVYSLRTTFWGFLFQVLSPQTACREVVRKVQSYCSERELNLPSSSTSAYCQARQRIGIEDLQKIGEEVSEQIHKEVRQAQRWKGHEVRVIDGTGISMPDTEQNQRAFPQPGGQKEGCGFPVMLLVGCFCLASGALLHCVETTLKNHESGILRKFVGYLKKAEVVLCDRGYCSYANLGLLLNHQMDAVMRLHQRRKCDFRSGQTLGRYDRLVTWKKPQRQHGFSPEEWAQLPAELTLRMVRFFVQIKGFRTRKIDLVTTFTDPLQYTVEDLADLYFRRWSVELFFRDIKTTMKMETVRCLTPEMVRKEIQLFFIAYNLIRALMQHAATLYQRDLHRLSFKSTVDTVRQYCTALNATRKQPRKQQRIIDEMVLIIAEETVPLREHRSEPRAVKRRPKPYQLLTKPRGKMKVSRSRRNKGKNRR